MRSRPDIGRHGGGGGREHKVTEQRVYSWRQESGAMAPADVKRLRQPEAENAKLKRMLAEREMASETLKEITSRKR